MDKFKVHGSKPRIKDFEDSSISVNTIPLQIHRQYCNHSEGFSWGYSGSGPSQTAFEILFDWFRRDEDIDDEKAAEITRRLYQRFKEDKIARIPQSMTEWYMLKDDIQKWVEDNYLGLCEVCKRPLRKDDPVDQDDNHLLCLDCTH